MRSRCCRNCRNSYAKHARATRGAFLLNCTRRTRGAERDTSTRRCQMPIFFFFSKAFPRSNRIFRRIFAPRCGKCAPKRVAFNVAPRSKIELIIRVYEQRGYPVSPNPPPSLSIPTDGSLDDARTRTRRTRVYERARAHTLRDTRGLSITRRNSPRVTGPTGVSSLRY